MEQKCLFKILPFVISFAVIVNAQETPNECPDISSCDIICPFGLKTDSDTGCEICECNPCPPIRCALFCENGYKLDTNGMCPICECEEEGGEDKCGTLTCDETCPFGHETELDGCMTCKCIENPCQRCNATQTCVINDKLEWDCEDVPGENEECDIDDDDDDREMSGSKSSSTGSKSTGSKSTGSKSSTSNCTHVAHEVSGSRSNGSHGNGNSNGNGNGNGCHNYTRNYTHSSSHSGSDSSNNGNGRGRASIPERVLEILSSNSQREEEREEQDRIRGNNNGAASRNFFRNLKTKSDSCREGYFCKQSNADSDGVCSAIPKDGPCFTSSSNPDEECDRNGYFAIKVCAENSDGDTECVCVEPVNGTKLEETRKVVESVKERRQFNCIDAVYGTCSVISNGRPYLVKHGREHFDRPNCRRCRCYSGDLYCDDPLTVCGAADGPSSCTLDDGTTVEHGESYLDDCNSCFCRNGKSICTRFSCSTDTAAASTECDECSSEKVKKVCGPNGKTYLNLCTAVKCAGFDENVILNGTCASNDPCEIFPCENGETCLRQGGVSCLAQGGCLPDEVRVCLNIRSGFQCEFGSGETTPTTPTDGTTPTDDGLIGSGDVDPSDTSICGTDGRSYPAVCHIIPNYARVQVAHAGRCDDDNCRGGKVCDTEGHTYENICALKTFSANTRLDYPGDCIDTDELTQEEYCQKVVDEGKCQYSSENCNNLVQPVVGCCPICGSVITLIVDNEELKVAASIVSSMSTLDNLMGNFLTSEQIFSDLAGRCKPLEASVTVTGNIEIIITHVMKDDEEFCVMKAKKIITRINSALTNGNKRQANDEDGQLSSGFQVVVGAGIASEVDDGNSDGGSSGASETNMVTFAIVSLMVAVTTVIITTQIM